MGGIVEHCSGAAWQPHVSGSGMSRHTLFRTLTNSLETYVGEKEKCLGGRNGKARWMGEREGTRRRA